MDHQDAPSLLDCTQHLADSPAASPPLLTEEDPKRKARKERNKESARRSREMRKEQQEDLQKRVGMLAQENKVLKGQIQKLHGQNQSILALAQMMLENKKAEIEMAERMMQNKKAEIEMAARQVQISEDSFADAEHALQQLLPALFLRLDPHSDSLTPDRSSGMGGSGISGKRKDRDLESIPGAPAIAAPQARRPHALSISHDTAFYRKDRTTKASRAHASSDSRDRTNATPPPDSTPLAAQVAQNEHEVQELRKKVQKLQQEMDAAVTLKAMGLKMDLEQAEKDVREAKEQAEAMKQEKEQLQVKFETEEREKAVLLKQKEELEQQNEIQKRNIADWNSHCSSREQEFKTMAANLVQFAQKYCGASVAPSAQHKKDEFAIRRGESLT